MDCRRIPKLKMTLVTPLVSATGIHVLEATKMRFEAQVLRKHDAYPVKPGCDYGYDRPF